jgi:inosine-uridine nucleoside N-ribohydrolase
MVASEASEKEVHSREMTLISSSSTASPPPVVIISDLSDYADDNIAILMLLRSGKFDVRGVISTSGNVCAERGAEEGRRFLLAAGSANVPIVRGFLSSWHRQRLRYYEDVEKPSRPPNSFAGALGDVSCADEYADDSVAGIEAVDFLITQARIAEGRLTIILIGPATVLAEAVRRDTDFPSLVLNVQAMGGAINVPGNVTQYSEFNVWFDPEAMASVLASRIPVTLVPLDAVETVTYAARTSQPEKIHDGFASSYLASYLKRRQAKRSPVPMWDEVLAAITIDPTLIASVENIHLGVSTEKDTHYGQILSMRTAPESASRSVRVVMRVHADGVRRLVDALLLGGD